jgi:hypothetical protein
MRGSCALNTKGHEKGWIRNDKKDAAELPGRSHHCAFCTDASPSMTTEVFNPNPTIIVTAEPSARRRAAQARQSLWLSDDEDSTTYDSDDEPEPIDADEIFGGISLSVLSDTARLDPSLFSFSKRLDSFNQ